MHTIRATPGHLDGMFSLVGRQGCQRPRLAYDLVPVSGHPQFQPGVTGILLRGRPHAQPVGAAVGAETDQVEGLSTFTGLGCRVMLEEHE
jgi:hypothetical protein